MRVADLFATLSLKADRTSWERGTNLIRGVKAALVGVATLASVKMLGGLINDTTELASKFVDLSQQIGIAVEPLQQLAYAAEQSGVSVDEMSGGLKRLSASIYEASNGGKEASSLFAELGVNAKDAAGKARPVEAVLADLAEAFKTTIPSSEKTAVAMKLFGKSGAGMVPLLNMGKNGIDELKARFVALGGQIDGPTAAAFEEFGDKQADLKVAWQGVKNTIASALLPTLSNLATRITDWAMANKELIKEKVTAFVNGVVVVARKLADVAAQVWPLIVKVASAIGWMVEKVGGAENAVKLLLGAFVALKAFPIVSALAGIVTQLLAVATAGNAAAAATGGLGAGLKGLLGKAGLVAGAGLAGYAVGTKISHELGLNEGDEGYHDDYMDPKYTAAKKEQRARRAALAAAGAARGAEGVRNFLAPLMPAYAEAGGAPGFEVTRPAPAVTRNVTTTVGATTINVHAAPGMDEQKLASLVREKIDDRLEGVWRQASATTGG